MNITIQDIFDFARMNPDVNKYLSSIPLDPPILIPAGSRFDNIEIAQDIHVREIMIFMPSKAIRLKFLTPRIPTRPRGNYMNWASWVDLNHEGLFSPRVAFELMNHLKKLAS